jgi:hypothetical protein
MGVAEEFHVAQIRHGEYSPCRKQTIVRCGHRSGELRSHLALISVGLLFVPFIQKPCARLHLSFIVYLMAAFAVTEIGNFPVPVIGAGASAILGWYLMLLLSRSDARETV